MNNWLRRTISARISLLKKWRKAYEEQNRLFPRDYNNKAIQKLTKQIEELQAVTDWLKTAGKDTNVPTKNEPKTDLNKIREEIEKEIEFWSQPIQYNAVVVVNARRAKVQSYKHCLEIIDKYKAESEG